MLGLLTGLPLIGQVVSWLFSPMGKIVMIVAAFLSWTAYQRHTAATAATAQCQTAELRADIKEITRQRDAAWAVLADAERRQAASEAAMARLEREGDAIKKDAAALKDKCPIPRGVTKRLSNIR